VLSKQALQTDKDAFGYRRRAAGPLEKIQHLLGHTSIKTAEIYIKARLPDLLAPTSRPVVKQQAGDGK
jgi:integrase